MTDIKKVLAVTVQKKQKKKIHLKISAIENEIRVMESKLRELRNQLTEARDELEK